MYSKTENRECPHPRSTDSIPILPASCISKTSPDCLQPSGLRASQFGGCASWVLRLSTTSKYQTLPVSCRFLFSGLRIQDL